MALMFEKIRTERAAHERTGELPNEGGYFLAHAQRRAVADKGDAMHVVRPKESVAETMEFVGLGQHEDAGLEDDGDAAAVLVEADDRRVAPLADGRGVG